LTSKNKKEKGKRMNKKLRCTGGMRACDNDGDGTSNGDRGLAQVLGLVPSRYGLVMLLGWTVFPCSKRYRQKRHSARDSPAGVSMLVLVFWVLYWCDRTG
jgi:hypothetical protein